MTGSEAEQAAVPIDTSRPHPARVYDWWLGGKDNYPVDEELARRILAVDGTVVRGSRAQEMSCCGFAATRCPPDAAAPLR
jgi:hypothetical protein